MLIAARTTSRGREKKALQRGTNRQCLGGVLFIISVKVKFSLVP